MVNETTAADEISSDLHNFFTFWFSGFERGLESLSATACTTILHSCGKACARSYTVPLFQQAWRETGNLDDFLAHLSQNCLEAHFERVGVNGIKATYATCDCDLVRLGLITSPALCECSAANLQENLEKSLGLPASVAIESSILRGATECVLLVTLEDKL